MQLATLGSMMALVPLTQGCYPAIVTVFVVWGIAGFGMMTPQQSRLVSCRAGAGAGAAVAQHLDAVPRHRARGRARRRGQHLAGLCKVAWAGVPLALLGLLTLVASRP